MSALIDAQGPDIDHVTATRMATLVIATIRGLLLDLLATGDQSRVQDAAESFLVTLRPQGGEVAVARRQSASSFAIPLLAFQLRTDAGCCR